MKVTEIGIYPTNKEGNQVVDLYKMEGDFNLINQAIEALKRSFERRKCKYIFRIEDAPANFYYYYFTSTADFEEAKRFIPNLDKTW